MTKIESILREKLISYSRARGRGLGRNRGNLPGSGPGGKCICPECGMEIPHQVGVPCYSQKCPRCGAPMEKKA